MPTHPDWNKPFIFSSLNLGCNINIKINDAFLCLIYETHPRGCLTCVSNREKAETDGRTEKCNTAQHGRRCRAK